VSANTSQQLRRIYAVRFEGNLEYRRRVWRILIGDFFGQYLQPGDVVLDLGCGYGEFINEIECAQRLAMDLNPDSASRLRPEVKFLPQDCSAPWPLADNSLDVVFTSNFFEHLPGKHSLAGTLAQAHRCLRPGGKLIALGPNIKYLPGAYWDFWDHCLPLTESSLSEGITAAGFRIIRCLDKFLPYTMANSRQYPVFFLRLYLRLPPLWRMFGKQFLVVARNEAPP
jgi:SAM-dependent methyltransferase